MIEIGLANLYKATYGGVNDEAGPGENDKEHAWYVGLGITIDYNKGYIIIKFLT